MRRSRPIRLLVVVTTLLLSGAGMTVGARPAGAAAAEPLVALGSLQPELVVGSRPFGVNDRGVIVGSADDAGGSARVAFSYDPRTQTMSQLEVLGRVTPASTAPPRSTTTGSP